MSVLRKILCRIGRYACEPGYERRQDPVVQRYTRIEERTENLYWKPRDLLDLR